MIKRLKHSITALMLAGIMELGDSSTVVHASSDIDCPPDMTATLSQSQSDMCAFGMGNAVLNPANDTRANLVLLMIRPTADQQVHNDDLWLWDYQSNSVDSPFYVTALQKADTESAEDRQKHYQALLITLNELGLNPQEVEAVLARINQHFNAPDLSLFAERFLAFQSVLNNATELSGADKNTINKIILALNSRDTAQGLPQEYASYFATADLFYNDQLAEADSGFNALLQAQSAWIKEAARYNRIRVAIRLAQSSSTDEYGIFSEGSIDRNYVAQILLAIEDYLSHYPNGQYKNSAQNLKRRAYWFSGDKKSLYAAYKTAIEDVQQTNDFAKAVALSLEVDNKFLFALTEADRNSKDPTRLRDAWTQIEWNSPVMATAQILLRLRKPNNEDAAKSYQPVALSEIKAHESNFNTNQGATIYRYLLLAYDFYNDANYEAVLKATENWRDNFNQADYVSFSIAHLRVQALEKQKRWEEAATLIKDLRSLSVSPLLKDHFELAHAENLEHSGQLKAVFSLDSPITSPALKKRLLRGSANAEILQYVLDQPHTKPDEKATALAALLHKPLMSKRFKELLEYQKKYSKLKLENLDGLAFLQAETTTTDENFKCPNWSMVLEDLTKATPSPRAQICLGERLRVLEDNYVELHAYENELGSSDDGFGTAELTRLALYLPLINNPAAKGEDEAFALRRSLYCFATAGYNHCGSEEIDPATRKGWFNRLKSEYKNSPWSKKQKYYW